MRTFSLKSHLVIALVFSILAFGLVVTKSEAVSTYWQAGTANWSGTNVWNNGEPTLDDDAYINNGGTAQVTAGNTEYANDLFLGRNSGQSGHVQMTGGALYTKYDQYIGYEGSGSFTQSGGENRCSYGTSNHDLYLGYDTGGTGTYTMSGGTLYTGDQYIGRLGSGTFIQSGGTNYLSATGSATPDNMYVGYATSSAWGTGVYRLSGTGQIIINHKNADIRVGDTYSGTISSGRFEWFRQGGISWADPSGDGKMIIGEGGTLAMGYDFTSLPQRVTGLENATLEVTNGATVTKLSDEITSQVKYLRIGSSTGAGYGIQQGGDVVVGQWAKIGDAGLGVATHNAGTFYVTTHLYLGINSSSASGTYRLNGGTLTVGGSIYGGSGTGTFIIDGGTLTLNGSYLNVTNFILGDQAGRSGSYTLASGKTANIGALTIGNAGTGTLSQTGGSIYAGSLTIGGGSSYAMTGGSLSVSGAAIIGQGGSATWSIGSQNPSVGSLTMRNGSITGTGIITAGSAITAENGSISAKLAGAVGLLKTTAGTITLSGANTFTGTTILRSGTLVAGTNAPSGAAGAFGNATSAIVVGDSGTQSGDNLSLLIGGPYTVGRPVSVYNYGNSVTLGSSNTSGTAAFSGNISLGRNVNLAALGGSGGALQFSGLITGSGHTATLSGDGNVKVLPASAGTTNGDYFIGSGGGRMLGGANTTGTVQYTGNITLGNSLSLAATGGGTVEFASGTWTTNNYPLTITGSGAGVVKISNTLNTSGAVTVSSGKLLVEGAVGGGGSALSVSSGTTLGGNGAITKPVDVYGTIAPGASTGILTVNGNLTLAGISLFELQAYRAEGPGAGYYDGLIVGGTGNTLTFGGTLNVVNFGAGPNYQPGQVFDLFDWGDNTTGGAFAAINLPSLPGGLQWKMFGSQPFDYSTGQIVVEQGTEVTHYGLAASLTVPPNVLLRGFVDMFSSITCTGSGQMDTLDFTGLNAVSGLGGAVSGPSINGTDVQHGQTVSNHGLTFRGTDYNRNVIVTPTVLTATNHTLGGDAIRDWTNEIVVNVGLGRAGPGDDRLLFGPELVGQGRLIALGPGGKVRDYTGLASKTSPGDWDEGPTLGTEAVIREGIDSTATQLISMQWRRRYDGQVHGEPGSEIPESAILTSDVLRLSGMDIEGGLPQERHRADVFVLQMTYFDPEDYPGKPHGLLFLDLGADHEVGGVGEFADRWLPAPLGNFGGQAYELVNMTWEEFRAAHPGELSELLGCWGWSGNGQGRGYSWAVINFNNAQFAVPEPATWVLLASLALLTGLYYAASRRQSQGR